MVAPPPWLVRAADGDDESRAWTRKTLTGYLQGELDGGWAFSGSQFEALGGGGDQGPDASRITAEDLVAVSLLGVSITEHAALRVLGRDGEAISALLEDVPVALDLHEATDADIGPGSPAERVWDLVRRRGDRASIGPTKTSKLLTRKRPRLVPVYDRVVRRELGLRNHGNYWVEVRDLLRADPRYVEELVRAREDVGLADRVSLARTFDALLWMSDPRRSPPPA
ncbi:DUF6308 family protein [Actinomycetospora aeridis]|uniref:DUF6308 family protein n=1 Tax=Actinomycetospora aeridis TaxID=3129231 RepID=A0ABU8N8G2_9PSEU